MIELHAQDSQQHAGSTSLGSRRGRVNPPRRHPARVLGGGSQEKGGRLRPVSRGALSLPSERGAGMRIAPKVRAY
jgi:hypothetical protein